MSLWDVSNVEEASLWVAAASLCSGCLRATGLQSPKAAKATPKKKETPKAKEPAAKTPKTPKTASKDSKSALLSVRGGGLRTPFKSRYAGSAKLAARLFASDNQHLRL